MNEHYVLLRDADEAQSRLESRIEALETMLHDRDYDGTDDWWKENPTGGDAEEGDADDINVELSGSGHRTTHREGQRDPLGRGATKAGTDHADESVATTISAASRAAV